MRQSDYNVKTGINSEIHASLRRLEDADYISEQVMMDNLTVLTDHVDEIDQRLTAAVNDLENEVFQLHTYIEPHIYQDDLQYFQTIYIGDFVVSGGGSTGGNVTVGGSLTVNGTIMADNGIDIYGGTLFTPTITFPDENTYQPRTFSIEGEALAGKILASQDLSFSLVGLVEVGLTGGTFVVVTKKNQILLGSCTVTPTAYYDSATNKVYSSALLTANNGLTSDTNVIETAVPAPIELEPLYDTASPGTTYRSWASAGSGYNYVEIRISGSQGGGGGSGTCFAAGTPITMADGTETPIERLTLGAMVRSYDTETEQFTASEVYSVQAYHNARSVYDLYIAGGRIVTVSDSHPILTRGGWKSLNPEQSVKEMRGKEFELSLLTEEDEVLTLDGYKALDRIVQREDLTGCTMYNIDVEEVDTFVAAGIVAHNVDPKYN